MNRRSLLIATLLVACAPVGATLSALPGTRWRLTAMGRSLATTPPDVYALPADAGVTLNFDNAGAASGNSGCNTYSAANVKHGAATLELGTMAMTQRACADAARNTAESQYVQLLERVRAHTINTNVLELRNATGELILRFERT